MRRRRRRDCERTCSPSCASAANSTTRSPAAAACSSGTSSRSATLRDYVDCGDRIASLVSLTLTPLADRSDLPASTSRPAASGSAAERFSSSPSLWAELPDDIDENVALAVLDVAGAPAQVARSVSPGQTVVGNRRGRQKRHALLRASQSARRQSGPRDRNRTVASNAYRRRLLRRTRLRRRIHRRRRARRTRDERSASPRSRPISPMSSINCVNVPGTELASILCTKDDGTVYFFSMSTSFTAAALGAEGVGQRRHDDRRQWLCQRSRADCAADAARPPADHTPTSTRTLRQPAKEQEL